MPAKPQYIHELIANVELHRTQLTEISSEADELRKGQEATKESVVELRLETAVLKQQLADLSRRVEEWDRRWWSLIVLLVSALLALASGLIVTLTRK